VPATITVYKTQTTVVTKADAIAMAKKFNISDIGDISEGDRKISVSSKDMRYCLQLFKTGGMSYSDYQRTDTPNGIDIAENLPTDEDAEKLATSFLKERGLMPGDAILGGTEHRKVYKLNKSGGSDTVVWEDILVYYTRELNGLKVEGTQFEVEVGGHGDIIRFFSNWKDYQPIGESPIKSNDVAIQEMRQKGIAAGIGSVKPDTVSINQIYLAYDTTAVAYKEDYLEPVWVFKGNALANGQTIAPVEEFIPALPVTGAPTIPATTTVSNKTTLTTTTTQLATATSSLTITVNETSVSPVPTDIVTNTSMVSLNVTQNIGSGNSTTS
jgi:hypothetical protein